MSYDERQLDAIVWPRTGKRLRECTRDELDAVIATINAEAEADRRRALAAELKIAAYAAEADQGRAYLEDGTGQAERWANSGDLASGG